MTDRKEYIERDSIVKAVVIQQDKERKDWMEHLQQLRGTKDYSSREIAVDNWLRGYNESVQYLVAKTEEMTAADVVEVVRCSECRFNVANMEIDPLDDTDYSGRDIVCGRFLTDGMSPDDYCSYGERKDGADDE